MNSNEFNTIQRIYQILDNSQPGSPSESRAVDSALGLLEAMILNEERLREAYADEFGGN